MAFTASCVFEVQTTGLDDFSTVSAVVAVGGTGYSVNDVLTVVGGTSTTTATFKVATVSGGVVLTVTPVNTGHYTVLPANPVATTGGAGTCTLTITWNAGGNGGGFDTGVAGFPTDGAITLATTSAPSLTSVSYAFVSGDIGAWVYLKSGSTVIAGWYKIANVVAGAAILNAAIGSAVLAAGTPSTVLGCATGSGPWTSITYGVDYSQGTAGQIAFTDMLVGATTTQFTSVLHPVGKNFIGNVIAVTSGATIQRVAVVSTSGTTATCDKTLGTAAQVGVGTMGGPLASPGIGGSLAVGNNLMFIQNGSYTVTSASANVQGGCVSWPASSGGTVGQIIGYSTVRGDFGTRPTLTASGIATFTLIAITSKTLVANIIVNGASLTSSRGIGTATNVNTYAYTVKAQNCTNGGIVTLVANQCETTGCATQPALQSPNCYLCWSHDNTITGFTSSGTFSSRATYIFCIASNNTTGTSDGFFIVGAAGESINCVAFGNTRDGFRTTNASGADYSLVNCLSTNNTGQGFTVAAGNYLLNCAGFSNAANVSGTPTINSGFVTITTTPFVASGSNNFALNNVTTGGALARSAGMPGLFPAGTTTGLIDIGATQSRAPWQTQGLSGGIEG